MQRLTVWLTFSNERSGCGKDGQRKERKNGDETKAEHIDQTNEEQWTSESGPASLLRLSVIERVTYGTKV